MSPPTPGPNRKETNKDDASRVSKGSEDNNASSKDASSSQFIMNARNSVYSLQLTGWAAQSYEKVNDWYSLRIQASPNPNNASSKDASSSQFIMNARNSVCSLQLTGRVQQSYEQVNDWYSLRIQASPNRNNDWEASRVTSSFLVTSTSSSTYTTKFATSQCRQSSWSHYPCVIFGQFWLRRASNGRIAEAHYRSEVLLRDQRTTDAYVPQDELEEIESLRGR